MRGGVAGGRMLGPELSAVSIAEEVRAVSGGIVLCDCGIELWVDVEVWMEGFGGVKHTARRLRLSSRWRGTTVIISISQRNATSAGVRPGCSGNAIVSCQFVWFVFWKWLDDALRRRDDFLVPRFVARASGKIVPLPN